MQPSVCRAPRLLAERAVAGDEIQAFDLDIETGTRGPVRARWPLNWRWSALSLDGRTLAQVTYPRGNAELSFLDLETGARRETHAQLENPQWRPDGTVIAFGAGTIQIGLMIVGRDGEIEPLAAWSVAQTRPGPFKVSPDGKTVAILTMNEDYTYWWAALAKD